MKKEQSALFVFVVLFGYFMAQTSFPWYIKIGLNLLAAMVCAAFTGILEFLDGIGEGESEL